MRHKSYRHLCVTILSARDFELSDARHLAEAGEGQDCFGAEFNMTGGLVISCQCSGKAVSNV